MAIFWSIVGILALLGAAVLVRLYVRWRAEVKAKRALREQVRAARAQYTKEKEEGA